MSEIFIQCKNLNNQFYRCLIVVTPETLFSVYQTLWCLAYSVLYWWIFLFSFKNRKRNRPKLQPPYCFETWPPNQKKPNKPAFPLFQQRWRTHCLMWWFIFRDRILNLFFFNILKLPVNSQGFLTTHVKSAVIFGSISRKTKTEDLRELIKIHYFWKVKSSLVWKCFSLAWG